MNLFSFNPANVLFGNFFSLGVFVNRSLWKVANYVSFFNLFTNDLLGNLEKTWFGATIGTIHIPALGFADDIVLISDEPVKLQNLINACETWADENIMTFNTSKCKTMVLNGASKRTEFTLNGVKLSSVDSYKYLGVTLTSKYITNLFRMHFSHVIEKAKVKQLLSEGTGFMKTG